MSTAAKFTVRDLSRRTAEVLAAMRKYGQAEVCGRSGEVIVLKPKKNGAAQGRKKRDAAARLTEHFENMWARQRALGYEPPKPGEWDEERFNRIIAGEE